MTSSLQLIVASPWSFLALQEYTPPSKLQGLRISREQIPWTQICLNLGSSPIIIWFFIHITLGCRKKTDLCEQNMTFLHVFLQGYGNYNHHLINNTSSGVVSIYVCATWLKWAHSTHPVWELNGTDMLRTSWGPPGNVTHVTPLPLLTYHPYGLFSSCPASKVKNTNSSLLIKTIYTTTPDGFPVGLWAQAGGERLRQQANKARRKSYTFSAQSQAADKSRGTTGVTV